MQRGKIRVIHFCYGKGDVLRRVEGESKEKKSSYRGMKCIGQEGSWHPIKREGNS